MLHIIARFWLSVTQFYTDTTQIEIRKKEKIWEEQKESDLLPIFA